MKRWMGLAALLACVTGISLGAPASIDIDAYTFTPLPTTVTSEKGTLLLSDSPEYVGDESGVVAAGTINGLGRVYFYHVNESKDDRKIGIVIENTGKKMANVTVKRAFSATPSSAYFEVGRSLSKLDLETKATTANTFSLLPGTREVLYDDLENQAVPQDALTSGIVDIQTSGPMYVRVMMMPVWMSAWSASRTLPVLPMDEVALRGTFKGMERTLQTPVYDSSLGSAAVEIANNREDPFLKGHDELSDNKAVTDAGNYGTTNVLTIPTTGTQPFAVYFNPMGGAYAGSIKIQQGAKATIYDVPDASLPHMGHDTIYDTMYLNTFQPGKDLVITYMPAGASNLPVRFLLVAEQPKEDAVTVFKEKLKGLTGKNTKKK